MKEYIDREAAENAIRNELPLSTWMKRSVDKAAHAMGVTVDAIESIPAADVEEVRHGRWIEAPKLGCAECSECGRYFVLDDWGMEDMEHFNRYCPNCGAKMDGGVNGV